MTVTRAALILFAIAGLLAAIVAGDSARVAAIVAGLVSLVMVWLLFRDPSAFLGIVMGAYGSVQFILQESQVGAVGGTNINASKIVVLVVTGLCLLRILVELARGIGRIPPSLYLAAAFTGASGFALFWSAGDPEALAVFGRIVACTVVLFFSYLFCRTTADFWKLAVGAGVAVCAAALVGAFDLATWRASAEALESSYHRAVGGFGGPVATGTIAFFGVGLGVAILAGAVTTKGGRVFGYILVVAGALGTLVTFTRTALFGAVVLSVLIMIWRKPAGRSRIAAWLVLAAVGAAFSMGFLFLSHESVARRFRDVPGLASGPQIEDYGLGSGRGMIWKTLTQLQARQGPVQWLVGNGLLAVQRDLQHTIMQRLDAHNSSLDMLYDMGFLGLVLYWVAGLKLAQELMSKKRWVDFEMAGLLRPWGLYCIAYLLSTEMFNGFVYAVGPRWYGHIISGALLGLASRETDTRA